MKPTRFNIINNYSLFLLISSVGLLWLALVFTRIYFSYPKITTLCIVVQIFIIDIINLVLIHIIFSKSKNDIRISKWLYLSIIAFFVVDISYSIVYILNQWKYVYVFDIIHFMYYIVTVMFFISILKCSLKPKQFCLMLIIAVCISISIFSVFSIDVNYFVGHSSLRNTIQITQSLIDLMVFSLAFLFLIYSKKFGASLIASGYILCTASEFMMTSCYMTHKEPLLDWAQLTWLLGLILIMYGMAVIVNYKSYKLRDWLVSGTSIKTKLTISTFAVAVLCLILFFGVMKEFSSISDTFYIFYPTFIMDFTLAIAVFSRVVGRSVEAPIIQIQKDIERSFEKNLNPIKDNLLFMDSRRYSEIQTIEMQIKSLISYIDKHSKDAAIGILAKQVAHNIKSPLLVLRNCKNRLKSFINVDEKLVNDLNLSINNIQYILINLLNLNSEQKYQTYEDSNKPRYILLKQLIDEIVNQKSIEWHNRCDIEYRDNTGKQSIWIFTVPYDFISAISNLLNNSYESFKNNQVGKIILTLDQSENSTLLNIQDNGCGIAAELVDKVLEGYSTKSGGHGIGLSTAARFFMAIGGDLKIMSDNNGTSINLTIPNILPPNWLPHKVEIFDYVVVLDDSMSIHSTLQATFTGIKNVKYFINMKEFRQWMLSNYDIKDSVTYFIDNQLDDSVIHGIDLIEEYKLFGTAYLTTNEYDNQLIQERADKLNIKIIPKVLMECYLDQ